MKISDIQHLTPGTYHIGIDCRFWGTKHAGLGRYTRNLVLEILKNSDHDFTLFFQRGEWQQDKNLLKNYKIIEVDIPHYSLTEQTKLPQIIDSQNLDFVHYPHFNFPILARTPFVVTIHDLIKHFFKGRDVTTRNLPTYYAKHLAYKYTINKAIKKSRAIITPSVFTRDQISSNFLISDHKIFTIYEGVSPPYDDISKVKTPSFKSLQKKYKLNKPCFVYTGSAYPSKNIPTLLKAVKQIDSKLIIACARNIFWDRLKKEVESLNLTKNVILPGKVPDEDLITLYQNAVAFVMPSLMEGFGLPALEAMSTGCPIISSNTGSLPEIYGKHALYFNPDNHEELAELMKQTLGFNEIKRQDIITKGQKYSRQYTWEKAAKETLTLYDKVLSK